MTYPRKAWYVAAWAQDISAEAPFAMTIAGEPLVIWRTASGKLHALEDRCVHRLAPLSKGRCEGERLRCMYHGLLFGGDGAVVEIPGQDLIPKKAKARSYAVAERHSWVWVWMGDAENADPDLIPPAVGDDDPDFILGHGQIDYEAEAQLINDNLLDFSHLTYVHANSFGAGDEFARMQPRIVPLDRGVRIERWLENSTGMGPTKRAVVLDNFQTYDFLAPGVLLMWIGNFPVGTAKACNFGRPDYADAVAGVSFSNQAVTPMASGKSRYFYSWGPHRSFGDEATRDILVKVAEKAFAEDKEMIEAQQCVIDITGKSQVIPTAHDKAITIFQRIMKSLDR